VDLARQMIRLAGLQPDHDIAIRFTGPRAGEKLREELFHGGEPLVPTRQPGVMIGAPRSVNHADVKRVIEALDERARGGDEEGCLALLARMVPEFCGAGPMLCGEMPELFDSEASAE
jgi:FlaA1/EpsC-like NDP-sugar epimerase